MSQYDACDMSGAVEDKSNFRQRLLDALEEGIAEDGYPRTTVADIVRRARTSRRTFYEHFDSRETCFVALLTDANAEQVRQISAAVDANAPWKSQVRQAIEAWISSGESRSSLMLSWIRDVPSLGAAARGLQRDAMENFIEMVRTLGDNAEFRVAGVGPFSRQRIIMLLGGLQELTAITVEEGGRMSDITEEAVDASIALLAPRVH
jgi:AcrR family transcriptional regulator